MQRALPIAGPSGIKGVAYFRFIDPQWFSSGLAAVLW